MRSVSQIRCRGYKSIRRMELDLGAMNILIGGNGAGKSNLLSFFSLLTYIVEDRLDEFVIEQGGAHTLLYRGPKYTRGIETRIVSEQHDMRLSFGCLYGAGDRLSLTPPVLSIGASEAEALSEVRMSITGPIRQVLGSWRVYHFHDTSRAAPVKQTGDVQDNRKLRADAGNLAAFLFMLAAQRPDSYRQIRDTVRMAAPFFDDFVLEPSPLNPDSILLRWRERGMDSELGIHQMSDGTLRFICLATLLLQPPELLPSLILIDEPELGLHPYAIVLLASLLRAVAQRVQVLIATQSIALLDRLAPEPTDIADVIVVDRQEGQSVFRRLEPREFDTWLADFSPGDLWEKGILGGSPAL